MTTKKLNLTALKVNSFITSLENKDAQTLKGGTNSNVAVGTGVIAYAVVTVAVLTFSIASPYTGTMESASIYNCPEDAETNDNTKEPEAAKGSKKK